MFTDVGNIARQSHRPDDAHRSNHGLSLLHHMDTTHGTLLLSLSLFFGLSILLLLLLQKTPESSLMLIFQPFVDQGHPLHDLFPPRVWAIRIPVILILLGSAVVGSFLSVVMIRSNRKKAAKARAVDAGKKKA